MDSAKNEIYAVSVKMAKEDMMETTKQEEKKWSPLGDSQKGIRDMAQDPNKDTPANTVTDPNLEGEIRHRAYALYDQRGREEGHDVDDWLRAEADFTPKTMKTAA